MNNQNYQKILDETLQTIEKDKRLLLHSCCGPCSSYVLTYLAPYFKEITVFYYNPNIYPKEEYLHRLEEQVKLIRALELANINIVTPFYNEAEFLAKTNGYANEKEGGKRCMLCYELRLNEAFNYAKKHKYDYVTTTLSVSPYQNSNALNNIGNRLSHQYNIPYLFSDFKKKEGYKKSILYSKKYQLYRQHYCGCRYSLENATENLKLKQEIS